MFVRLVLLLHIAGGGTGLLAGFAALYAVKGGRFHRRWGRIFVYAMLAMALSGVFIAALTGVATSVLMGAFTAYLVFTGMTAVAPIAAGARWLALGGAAVALAVASALLDFGFRALASPSGVEEGLPAPMAFIFGCVALLAGLSDLRVLVAGSPRGRQRVARHLWRMCLALFIAAASFFLGQTNVIPRPLRSPPLLAIPVVVPLLVMMFWLWRTRTRRIPHVAAPSSSPDAA